MHLKKARAENKIEHFIAEKEKTHPQASHPHFHSAEKRVSLGLPQFPG
jgi:hypothetical protein